METVAFVLLNFVFVIFINIPHNIIGLSACACIVHIKSTFIHFEFILFCRSALPRRQEAALPNVHGWQHLSTASITVPSSTA